MFLNRLVFWMHSLLNVFRNGFRKHFHSQNTFNSFTQRQKILFKSMLTKRQNAFNEWMRKAKYMQYALMRFKFYKKRSRNTHLLTTPRPTCHNLTYSPIFCGKIEIPENNEESHQQKKKRKEVSLWQRDDIMNKDQKNARNPIHTKQNTTEMDWA